MQLARLSLAMAALGLLASPRPAGADSVRVMTFNLRFATAADGDNAWPLRRDLLLKVIADYEPDILGVQEALREQLEAISVAYSAYSLVGVGREANGGGEYSAIFYRRGRFDLAAANTFWLSATPSIPGSKSWGNTLPRICTWVELLDRTNDRRFYCFNTHWDHQSQPARLKGAELMAKRITSRLRGQMPALVMGDLNADEDNPAIGALTRKGELLSDSFRALHPDAKDAWTFHGFTGVPEKRKIDYVLTTRQWRVSKSRIVRDHDGARYPSDHFPVIATVSLDDQEPAK
jgi:endonuclease/exonuclease/phosphatase family metal-dependent hydrolase